MVFEQAENKERENVNMLNQEETVLTHEGYLKNTINGMLRDCQTMKKLSKGRNSIINQATAELEEVCHKVLEELETCPSRMTKAEWAEDVKKWRLKAVGLEGSE